MPDRSRIQDRRRPRAVILEARRLAGNTPGDATGSLSFFVRTPMKNIERVVQPGDLLQDRRVRSCLTPTLSGLRHAFPIPLCEVCMDGRRNHVLTMRSMLKIVLRRFASCSENGEMIQMHGAFGDDKSRCNACHCRNSLRCCGSSVRYVEITAAIKWGLPQRRKQICRWLSVINLSFLSNR